jgi:hypothetical protein
MTVSTADTNAALKTWSDVGAFTTRTVKPR